MQTEDKHNQIKSWFRTLKPPPEMPKPPKMPKIPIGKIIKNGCTGALGCGCLGFVGSIFFSIMYAAAPSIFTEVAVAMVIPATILTIIVGFVLKFKAEARIISNTKAEIKANYEKRIKEIERAQIEYETRPSDSQMSQWLSEDLDALKEKAFKKTRLDESEIKAGPLFLKEARTRSGEAPIYGLAEVWAITILYIGEKSILAYRCEYDWENDEPLNESITEYLYRDIIAVEKTDSIIGISMNNGNPVEINLNKSWNAEELSNRGADNVVQSIRRFLRDQ